MDTVASASSLLETTRDLTLDAVQAAAARTFGSTSSKDPSISQIKKLLDSRFDQEIHEGLRKTINLMYKGQECLPLFSAVIKNVASPNVEIKKLVYIYLLKYAEQEPDLALLSINTIQKSLSDQNPQVRAMALRVMSGIRVSIISQIVSLAIKKGCGDMSAVVRKTAALAIPKCYRLEPSTEPQMVDYISQLLGDKQYYVVGPAVTAFLEVCPDRTDLIHKHYRGLVKKLVDMDDWGQLALIKLLTVYARRCFPNPSLEGSEDASTENVTGKGKGRIATIDPDLKLFLDACKTLLKNRNPAVILAVARAFVYVATEDYVQAICPSLIALLRGPSETHEVVLYNIVPICIDNPSYFTPFMDHFWIRSTDNVTVRRLKLEILTLIFPECDGSTKGIILSELEHLTTSADADLVRESVRAIGRCARSDASTISWCMNLLLRQISSPDDNLVGEVLTVVRHLIQREPDKHRSTIIRLAKNLDTIYNDQARATVIWLVGEYAATSDERDDIAPDVLRILTKGFAQEETAVKSQILLLAAKVYLHHLNRITPEKDIPGRETEESPTQHQDESATEPENGKDDDGDANEDNHPVAILWEHIQLLVRYDTSYELRDRARLYKNVLAGPEMLPMANLILLAPKPVPQVTSPSEARKGLLLGSAALLVGEGVGPSSLPGYEKLPDWVDPDDIPDPGLRGVEGTPESTSATAPAVAVHESATTDRSMPIAPKPRAPMKSLNDWLDEEEDTRLLPATGVTETNEGDEEEVGDDDYSEEEEDESDESEESESDESAESDEESDE